MSFLIQRLTTQLTSQRTCLINLHKASRLHSQPWLVKQFCSSSGSDGHSNDNGKKDVLTKKSTTLPTDESDESIQKDRLQPSLSNKYRFFEKNEQELILDYSEELSAINIATDYPSDDINFPFRERQSKFDNVNLERGKKEVIDIEELVEILRQENMENIAVLSLPMEMRYTDYMLMASAKSIKHLEAVTAFLVKVWKLKRHDSDPFLTVEGEDSPDWKTVDMRTIMVHLFLPETREKYDLESLWGLGAQFDDQTQKPASDPSVDLLEKHIEYLKSLKPAEPVVRRAEMIPISVKPGTMTKQQMKSLQQQMYKERLQSEPVSKK